MGRAVQERLLADGVHEVRAAFRVLPTSTPERLQVCHAPDLGPQGDWRDALSGIDAVIHCAARVHVMHEQDDDPLQAFRRVNVAGTLQLARQAVEAGVRRFIYLSSIKVNGEMTRAGQPFRADDPATATDPYGISKWEAEEGLFALARDTGLEVVVVRPPLVYGPDVRANFLSMMNWLKKGVPLPFGAIRNQRSLVAVGNLADLLRVCLDHPAAAGQRFLVSDGDDLSTSELLRQLGVALRRPAWLVPVPQAWLEMAARVLGRDDIGRRLCGSLQVDIAKTRTLLNWTPPLTVEQALALTATRFLDSQSR